MTKTLEDISLDGTLTLYIGRMFSALPIGVGQPRRAVFQGISRYTGFPNFIIPETGELLRDGVHWQASHVVGEKFEIDIPDALCDGIEDDGDSDEQNEFELHERRISEAYKDTVTLRGIRNGGQLREYIGHWFDVDLCNGEADSIRPMILHGVRPVTGEIEFLWPDAEYDYDFIYVDAENESTYLRMDLSRALRI